MERVRESVFEREGETEELPQREVETVRVLHLEMVRDFVKELEE